MPSFRIILFYFKFPTFILSASVSLSVCLPVCVCLCVCTCAHAHRSDQTLQESIHSQSAPLLVMLRRASLRSIAAEQATRAMLIDVSLALARGVACSRQLTCQYTSECVSTWSCSEHLSPVHTRVCTHTLFPYTLGLPSQRQGRDSSSRTQTRWGQRACLREGLVLRPHVLPGLGVVGVVGSGSASQWELGRDKGPHSALLPQLHPCGSCPPEAGGGILAKASWLPLFVAWPAYSVWPGIRFGGPQQNGLPSVAGDRNPAQQ